MLERVNRLAREAKTTGDERSIDQVSADVFSDLVTGRGLTTAPAGSVDITVDLATLPLVLLDEPDRYVVRLALGPYDNRVYLVGDPETRDMVIIDAATEASGDPRGCSGLDGQRHPHHPRSPRPCRRRR